MSAFTERELEYLTERRGIEDAAFTRRHSRAVDRPRA